MEEDTVQFADRILKCSECHGEFVFTAGEQIFFNDKQFKNDPKRCKACKAKHGGARRPLGKTGERMFSRTETRAQCSACGVETTVPFKPTQGRPVLCRSCFQARGVPSAVQTQTMGEATMEMIAEAPAESLKEVATAVIVAAAQQTPQS
jgi:CxxC-x17-CxxC domain-containing protein